MTGLNYYSLNFALAHSYFTNNLRKTNILSSFLLKLVNFKLGNFFTLLPEGIDSQKIHEFKQGGIAVGVRDQISNIVLKKISSGNTTSCIFDDVASTFRYGYDDSLFLSCGLHIEKEIYYIITKDNASISLIDECFIASDAIWHSMCVLTDTNFSDITDNVLNLEKVNSICLGVQLIILGAYDEEGYIFWEKASHLL